MHRTFPRTFVLAGMAVLLSASLALAQPAAHDHGSDQAGGQVQAQALTPEQQAKLDTIMAEHRAKTFALRQDIWAKQTELNALSVNPNTKPAQITKLVGELKDLRAKKFAAHEELRATLAKEGLPFPGAGCPMMGGMMGGMKHGKMGGMGKGGCGMMGGQGKMGGQGMGPAMMGGRGMAKTAPTAI